MVKVTRLAGKALCAHTRGDYVHASDAMHTMHSQWASDQASRCEAMLCVDQVDFTQRLCSVSSPVGINHWGSFHCTLESSIYTPATHADS